MKLVRKNLFIIIIFAFLTCTPIFVLAQQSGTINPGGQSGVINPGGQTGIINPGGCNPGAGKICNPISENTIQGFIAHILEEGIKLGMPLIALAIIYSGFLFVAARGNPESLKKAKSALLYTLIGAGILLGAWSIAKVISETVLSL